MPGSVTATPRAAEAVRRLVASRGPLVFHQSGGCCEGSSPMCLLEGEMPPGRNDLLLGEIAGAPFYVDAEQYERWRRPSFLIDLSPGPAEGFSLSPTDAHFVARAPAGEP